MKRFHLSKLLLAGFLFFNLAEGAIDPSFSAMNQVKLSKEIKRLYDECIALGGSLTPPVIQGMPLLQLKREATKLKKELEKLKSLSTSTSDSKSDTITKVPIIAHSNISTETIPAAENGRLDPTKAIPSIAAVQ
jgi:hypothetical protein